MTAWLMASRPGDYTKEGLIVGNPEAVANGISPAGTYGAAVMTFAVGAKRLLSIVTDAAIDVLQTSENQDSSTAGLVPTRVPVPASGQVSYACFIHPSTTAIYVKSA